MDELTTTFAEARFGKRAFNPAFIEQIRAMANMPQLPENRRKLRDLIEKSVREEQRKLQKAKKLIGYGKQRLTDPNRMGGAGTMALDTIRALIPGLSISASADEGIEKKAKDPEEKAPGRAFDVLHGLAAATGAGTGVAAQKGLFGGLYGKDVAERMLGGPDILRGKLMEALPDTDAANALKKLVTQGKGDISLAAQQHTPVINRITRLFSPTAWSHRFSNIPAPRTSGAEARQLYKQLRRANIPKIEARKLMTEVLPKAMMDVKRTARTSMPKEMLSRLPGGWKGGLLGALIMTAPFAIYRLLKTRKLRARGGTAAESAAEKAEKLLSEAGELRKGRQKLLAGA
jgi:hypothetical protein